MIKPRLLGTAGLLLIVLLAATAWAQSAGQEHSSPPRPGSVNYVEGQASVGGETLGTSSVGSVELQQGQTLTTQNGKVEILLTPGVFLRVDNNSAVKMVSPDLANTEVAIVQGRAMVEALNITKDNNIRVDINDSFARLLKNGLYDFDAATGEVRVFKGDAEVDTKGQKIKVGGEHEFALNSTGKLKSQGFDTRKNEDDFFRWNALRSGYESEAGVDEARAYIGTGPGWYGPGWYGAGWYWDPYFGGWTFLPSDGVFYSPFGWGFYSPIVVYRSPFFFGGGGYWGRQPHNFNEFHAPYGHGFEPQGGFHGGGFRGGGFGGGGRR